jgi:hypothetical protein
MANDIIKAIDANPIKHGTLVLPCKPTGLSNKDVDNSYVINTPYLVDIESKYQNRFDNPSYYHGGGIGSVDGGDIGDGDGDTGIYDGGTYDG